MSHLDEMVLLTRKVNEAMKIFSEAIQEVIKELNDLWEYLIDKDEAEKESVFNSKKNRIWLKKVSKNRTESFYRQPYVQVPRHLAYQKRHYQS